MVPLIVVVLPGAQALSPELGAPPVSGTTIVPVPATPGLGPLPPLLAPPAGGWLGPAPAVEPTLLPESLEFPQAIEPSSARPMHTENGLFFISNFLRSIGGRHLRSPRDC